MCVDNAHINTHLYVYMDWFGNFKCLIGLFLLSGTQLDARNYRFILNEFFEECTRGRRAHSYKHYKRIHCYLNVWFPLHIFEYLNVCVYPYFEFLISTHRTSLLPHTHGAPVHALSAAFLTSLRARIQYISLDRNFFRICRVSAFLSYTTYARQFPCRKMEV